MDEGAELPSGGPPKNAGDGARPADPRAHDSLQLKAIIDAQKAIAGSPAVKAMLDAQKAIAGSPGLKAVLDAQKNIANSPGLKAVLDAQENIGESPAIKAVVDAQKNIANSPGLKAVVDAQKNIANSPGLRAVLDAQKNIANSPGLRAVLDAQKNIANLPGLKAVLDAQKNIASSLPLKPIVDFQRRLVGSPTLNALGHLQHGLRSAVRSVIERYADSFEAALQYYDTHWGELETEHPDRPQPVLFVIGSLGVALGMPLYEAAKLRSDDSELLNVLEPVVTDPVFIEEVQAAAQVAAHLSPIQRRHLTTALSWLSQRQYVDAYPPFYQGLEAAFYRVARAQGVIDDENHFLNKKGKARKVEDLFADLIGDARFRRYLRVWVFGERGNPFRHGDIDDPEECRRQALRLAVALIGWLELCGGWQTCDFEHRLQLAASERRAQGRS